MTDTRKPRWDQHDWQYRENNSFDPACTICNDLFVPAALFEESIRRYYSVPIKVEATLRAFHEGADNDCVYCSIIFRAVLCYLSCVLPDVEEHELDIDFHGRIAGDCTAMINARYKGQLRFVIDVFRAPGWSAADILCTPDF